MRRSSPKSLKDLRRKSATVFQTAISASYAVSTKPTPDGDLMNRHPTAMRFFERAKLRSFAEKAALFSLH
jgi:hypothetical protein